ncbi:hypothetical protein [Herbidospora sp. NBRC 101105]|uniref:hypothetical protein n=1 Tax=Herbidospora sp. NBRC 101105 TaxID=3032195 RepID=UPI00249FB4E7|nr:hypothetical protein [Herbidospora sp. NBRC 101105]GLX93932.1 hypothetical protein Hesp01_18820 [Herbidospora sp. NBRC 101105]
MTSELTRRPGRFRSWFRPTEEVIQPVRIHRIDLPFTFHTPAQTDAMPFFVTARLQWTAFGPQPESALEKEIGRHRERWRNFVDDTIRGIARTYPPHHAEEAETEVNRRLNGLRVFEGGVQIDCTAVCRLTPAQPILDQRQAAWLTRIRLEDAAEQMRRDIASMRELRRLWRDFLNEGLDDWLTPYAVRLAEGGAGIAETTERLLEDRRSEAERLLDVIKNIIDAQQAADVYEFTVRSETVMRKTLEMMGLPVPDPVPGSIFNDPAKD